MQPAWWVWDAWAANMFRTLQRGGHEMVVLRSQLADGSGVYWEGCAGATSVATWSVKTTYAKAVWLMLPAGEVRRPA